MTSSSPRKQRQGTSRPMIFLLVVISRHCTVVGEREREREGEMEEKERESGREGEKQRREETKVSRSGSGLRERNKPQVDLSQIITGIASVSER